LQNYKKDFFSIAIDGPAGSGKSTIAKNLAKILKFKYISSGDLYRFIAYLLINNGIIIEKLIWDENHQLKDQKLEVKIEEIIKPLSISFKNNKMIILYNKEHNFYYKYSANKERYSLLASLIANLELIRKLINMKIQKVAKSENIIVDGRDIGTIVLPKANFKIYLDADVDIRTKRRITQLLEKGEQFDILEIKNKIVERDYQDIHRTIAPLNKAKDAIIFDSSKMTIMEMVHQILDYLKFDY